MNNPPIKPSKDPKPGVRLKAITAAAVMAL
jgi:hypothetical protein